MRALRIWNGDTDFNHMPAGLQSCNLITKKRQKKVIRISRLEPSHSLRNVAYVKRQKLFVTIDGHDFSNILHEIGLPSISSVGIAPYVFLSSRHMILIFKK